LEAFATVSVQVPSEAAVHDHYTQNNAPIFMPSGTAGVATNLMEVCMIPLMWAPYFIMGGTPKDTLNKIELLVASVPRKIAMCMRSSRCAGDAMHMWQRAH
jgi:hypothetical protein